MSHDWIYRLTNRQDMEIQTNKQARYGNTDTQTGKIWKYRQTNRQDMEIRTNKQTRSGNTD